MTESDRCSFGLVITGAPYDSQAPQTALEFAQSAIKQGHSVNRVFLYGKGVLLASRLSTPPSDETNWSEAWSVFLSENQIPATACIASALRRGILDEGEQNRHQKTGNNLLSPFELAGLGDWVELLSKSDRMVYFHGGGA